MYIEGSYNYYLVILSVVIAILAAFAGLNITSRISYTKGKQRIFWLVASAIVMGNGIWAFHFIGMLSFNLGVKVEYDISLTLISVLASITASFIAFYITMPQQVHMLKIILGGFFMASGIVAMHYIGMSAMKMPVEMTYDNRYLILSIGIAFFASCAASLLFIRYRDKSVISLEKWLSATTMGIAIAGMHYTGMKANIFYSPTPIELTDFGIDMFLLYGVTLTIIIILFISWGAMLFDRNQYEKMAYEDPLTGLSNRHDMNRFFSNHSGETAVGVLFLDLDHFKIINDTLGHDVGDLLIKTIASRLLTFKRQGKVFRIGGDEFLLITENLNRKELEKLANKILKALQKPYLLEEHEIYTTGSIGLSLGTIDANNPSTLLRQADTAMYYAKKLGKNRVKFYSEQIGLKETRRMQLTRDIQTALKNEEFFLMYQPKWHTKTDTLYGFEALLRWQHPKFGLISPSEFIPIAEETSAINPITVWILNEVSRQAKSWHNKGVHQPISVNLSTKIFQPGNLVNIVQQTLEENHVQPELLELEITESIVLHDVDNVSKQLEEIQKLGVRVALDDFGVGYSSIGVLDQIPLNAIKLNRLFVNDLDRKQKRAVIQAILMMASALSLDVIAEGVEEKEQIDTLTALGCEIMQGYYYSKPLTASEMNEWMINQSILSLESSTEKSPL